MVSKLMPGVRGPQQSQEVCTGSPSVTGGVDGVPISHRRCGRGPHQSQEVYVRSSALCPPKLRGKAMESPRGWRF